MRQNQDENNSKRAETVAKTQNPTNGTVKEDKKVLEIALERMRQNREEMESKKGDFVVITQNQTNEALKETTDVSVENAENRERSLAPLRRRIGRYISKFTKHSKPTLSMAETITLKDENRNSFENAISGSETFVKKQSKAKEITLTDAQKISNKKISDSLKSRNESSDSRIQESASDSKISSTLRRSSSLKKSRYSNRRKNPASVTFSPTVTVTSRDLRRTKSWTTPTRPFRSHGSTTSETSDTDSTSHSHSSVGK